MTKEKIGLWAGILLGLIVWFIPLPALTLEAHRLAAIVTFIVIYWITEPLPVPITGLIGLSLAILAGVAPAEQVLSAFGEPIIFLFIGSFILAKSMQEHAVDRRIAYAILAHPWVGGRTKRTLWAFGLVAWLLAMWISITACVAMLYPVALAVGKITDDALRDQGHRGPSRYTTSLLLMLVYAAAAGAMATPVGTPVNLIGIEFIQERLGVSIGFLSWMSLGLPIAVASLVLRYQLLLLLFPPALTIIPGQHTLMVKYLKDLGPWTTGERNSLVAFGTAVLLWILPGSVSLILGPAHPTAVLLTNRLSPGLAALLAAGTLFLLPTSWKKLQFTLTWDKAVQIDWGVILLFGSGIAIGKMMLATGLADVVGQGLLGNIHERSVAGLIGVAILTAVLLSELASNTAAANMIIPVVLSVVGEQKAIGLMTALATTLAVSLGFMLPVATPGNAIIYGSGRIRIRDMALAGILVDLLGVAVIWTCSLWLIPLLF